jgi:Carbohydrate-selective porin, OprB family/S-layer homology domain
MISIYKQFFGALLLSPALVGLIVGSSQAKEVQAKPVQGTAPVAAIEPSRAPLPSIAAKDESDTMDQVTSVSQLTDVRADDWPFQALQSLVERYGCIVGYPDKTFRGNQSLTRYEFAAGLNSCLDRVNELIQAGTADLVKKEDLAVLQRLQEEFRAELTTLRGRVDALEARTNTLQKQQFSTTTKLNGEVVAAITGVATGEDANGNDIDGNTVFGTRVRLNFDASFTGEDLLRVRLQSSNLDPFSATQTGTFEGDQRFAAGDGGNSVVIDALLYQFPLGKKTIVTLEANAGAIDDFTDTVNPYFDGDGGSGAFTNFGSRNAIYYLVNGTGIGIRHQFSDNLELSLGYLANDAANPAAGSGLFDGPYGAIAQVTFKPSEKFTLGLTYINAYNTDFTANGPSGSNRANVFSRLSGAGISTSSNAIGAAASFQLSPKLVLNGSVGYTRTRTLSSGGGFSRGELDIWNWSVGLAAPDFLRKGSVAGILVGMEPRASKVSSGLRNSGYGRDVDTSFHIEGFYQYQMTDNLAITPGVIWLTAPDHNRRNSDIVIGTVRATFTF